MLRPLECLYLALGVGILIRGSLDHGLTVPELGAALFLIGLLPVQRADKAREGDTSGLIRKAVELWLRQQR